MKDLVNHIYQLFKANNHADDYELSIEYTDNYDARFAQNAISQHLTGQNITIRYEASINKKTAGSSSNQYDDESILNLIKTTEELALFNQVDPEYSPTISKQELLTVKNSYDSTLNLNPEKVISIIKESIQYAINKGTVLSGIFTKHIKKYYLFTKNGFKGVYEYCYFEYSMTMKKDDRETKISITDKDFNHFDLNEELNRLYMQFSALNSPQSMNQEPISVILRPPAVANLFPYLFWIMDRKMADDGITPFKNQIGKQFFGQNFSLSTLINDESMIIKPFNHATTLRAIDWITKGIINELPTSKSYAHMIHSQASSMFNAYIPGGKATEQDMMNQVKRGLIINNFWYIRPNDFKTADFTGMTRDGVLYFEDGEIKHSVNNFRFNEKLPDLTHRILSLGESVICSITNKMPTMLISDFNFVDKTNF